MLEYYDLFVEQGFGEQMNMLSTLTDEDLQGIGITNMTHRKKILLQIQKNKNITPGTDGYNVDSMETGYDEQGSDDDTQGQ